MAEEYLWDHFPADEPGDARARPATPVMPASLIVEGMAQSGGILVGHAGGFRQKVILAKVSDAALEGDAFPGMTLRYTATMRSYDEKGASVSGRVELLDPATDAAARPIGSIDLVFSHLDNNRAGDIFPAHNFVFGPSFKMILEQSGIPADWD